MQPAFGRITALTDEFCDENLDEAHAKLSRKTIREVTSHGWELASSSTYPFLLAANLLAGGIPARDGSDLILIIDAVAGFSREEGREIICPWSASILADRTPW